LYQRIRDVAERGYGLGAETPQPKPASRATHRLVDAQGNVVSEHIGQNAAENAKARLGDPRARVEKIEGTETQAFSGIPIDPEIATEGVKRAARGAHKAVKALGNGLLYHSEELADRLDRTGLQRAKEFAERARNITSEAQRLFGELSIKSLHAALRATGRNNDSTKWLNALKVHGGGKFGQTNFRRALESGQAPELVK